MTFRSLQLFAVVPMLSCAVCAYFVAGAHDASRISSLTSTAFCLVMISLMASLTSGLIRAQEQRIQALETDLKQRQSAT